MNSKSQVNRSLCFLCNQLSISILCNRCCINPFLIEDARQKAAKTKNFAVFKNLYSSKFPSIKNFNSQIFWDREFTQELSFSNQDSMTQEKIKTIYSLLPREKGKLLDVGFGQGYFEEYTQNRSTKWKLYGIDISANAVKKAQKKFHGVFTYGNISYLRKLYDKNSFDAICALEVIEHISPKNVFKFYEDVYTLLKPGGTLIISTPLNEYLRNRKDNPSGHVRDYSPEVIKTEMQLSGFKVEDVYFFHAFNKFYPLKKILAKVFPRKWEYNNIVIKAVKG